MLGAEDMLGLDDAVGEFVGEFDGALVGDFEGSLVGVVGIPLVGSLVGSLVGVGLVGLVVGLLVGLRVGQPPPAISISKGKCGQKKRCNKSMRRNTCSERTDA